MPYKDIKKNAECKKRWREKHADYFKQYYKKHKEKVDDYKKEYYKKHKEKIDNYTKDWYQKNKDKILLRQKENYENNKDDFLKKQKEFREKNKDKIKESSKKTYQKYRLERIQKVLNYQETNKEKRSVYLKKWGKTDNGKLFMAKKRSKRRKMKMIPLFISPFPKDIETIYHHINNIITIPLPKIMHQQTVQGKNIEKHREECNEIIQSIYCLNVNKITK